MISSISLINNFYNTDIRCESCYLISKKLAVKRVRWQYIALVITAILLISGVKIAFCNWVAWFITDKLLHPITHITVNRAKLKGIGNYICPLFLRKKFYQISLFDIKISLPCFYKTSSLVPNSFYKNLKWVSV